MNLLLDDSRLPLVQKYKEGNTPYDTTPNQYRLALNLRTRFDVCSPVPSSVVDDAAPSGVKQAILTFGNYVLLFCAGKAYYKLNGDLAWTQIEAFSMSTTAPRYWTVTVPVNITNYGRLAGQVITGTTTTGTDTTNTYGAVSANLPITQINVAAGTFGNNAGLLVQDGVNQPQFIYIDANGVIQCRTTQSYSDWSFPLDADYNLTGADAREYVPIGTYMAWSDSVLFIVDPTFTYIYRSVSGRPLDFVINVDENGQAGGDARTTSYSVGVNGITAMKTMSGNTLFVAAGGASCFSVSFDKSNVAVKVFGEWTFERKPLFNANCITDRGIIDVAGSPDSPNSGDSVFIDANGLRSFNAILQEQNEGRNSIFSATVQSLFDGIHQSAKVNATSTGGWCAAINYDNYAIFSVLTTLGYVLVIYDTINNCYTAIDTQQVGNHAVKQFAAINIDTLALYAITDDDRVVQLFASPDKYDAGTIRLGAVCEQDPKKELKVTQVRAILSNITQDLTVTCSLFTNNRYDQSLQTDIKYVPPAKNYNGINVGTDVGTQTNNILFSFPNAEQGWKSFVVLTWTGGASLVSTSISTVENTPMQPLRTQAVVQQTSNK